MNILFANHFFVESSLSGRLKKVSFKFLFPKNKVPTDLKNVLVLTQITRIFTAKIKFMELNITKIRIWLLFKKKYIANVTYYSHLYHTFHSPKIV